jgi:glycosyltransferase involved in cell wall biosynthesis
MLVPRRLLVISHVTHYAYDGHLHAFGPYALEIDRWAQLFERITIAAPLRAAVPTKDALRFKAQNIDVAPQREVGGVTWRAKVVAAAAVPQLMWSLARSVRRTDAVHVRCPGNLGLIGSVIAPALCRYRVAKYAGQWTAYPGEPWTERLQRWILRSPWWGAPVMVYGKHPGQPRQVIPFFTSVLTGAQVARARRWSAHREVRSPPKVLFVGRLDRSKNVDVLLRALGECGETRLRATIVGDGAERPALEALATRLGLTDRVTFTGAVEHEHVLGHYEDSDVLVLASEAEGWPKAIAEGMCFGLICIGGNRGLVPVLLGESRGLVVKPGDVAALAGTLREVAAAPERFRAMQARASAWAQQHSLEGLQEAIREMLAEWWRVDWGASP